MVCILSGCIKLCGKFSYVPPRRTDDCTEIPIGRGHCGRTVLRNTDNEGTNQPTNQQKLTKPIQT